MKKKGDKKNLNKKKIIYKCLYMKIIEIIEYI